MKNIDPFELLNRIDDFYNSAWDKLVIYTTILLVVVGIVVPLVISWFQNRNLKLKEENLRKEIENDYKKQLSIVKTDLLKQVDTEISKKVSEFESKQEKMRAELKGLHFHLQATTQDDLDHKGRIVDFIYASTFYVKAEDYLNLRTTVECICNEIAFLTKEEVEEMRVESADINHLLANLEKINEKGIFTVQIRDLRKKLTQIQK